MQNCLHTNAWSQNRLATYALKLAGWLVVLSGVLVRCDSVVQAAGCQYSLHGAQTVFDSGVDGRVAEIYWWSTGPLIRVYRDGCLRYYQAPTDGQPCHGPQCRGQSTPPAGMDVCRLTESHRVGPLAISQRTLDSVDRTGFKCQSSDEEVWDSPLLDGPLRPPC